MNNTVRTTLICMVSFVWAANFIAPIFVKGFSPPEGVHLAFMTVVGYLTAGYDKKGKTSDSDKADSP